MVRGGAYLFLLAHIISAFLLLTLLLAFISFHLNKAAGCPCSNLNVCGRAGGGFGVRVREREGGQFEAQITFPGGEHQASTDSVLAPGWAGLAEWPSTAGVRSAVDRRLLVYKNHNPASRGWAGARHGKVVWT